MINLRMDMRKAIQLIEMNWGKKPDTTFWFDARTGALIDCRTFHHTEFVLMAPDRFRLTPKAVMRAAGWRGDDYDAFCNWAADTQHDIVDEGVIQATIDAGFVRVIKEVERFGGRQRTTLGLQGTPLTSRKALIAFQEEGFFPDVVYTQGWRLTAEAIETFAQTGQIVSDERGDAFNG